MPPLVALAIAALTLVLVLVVGYMVLRLYNRRRADAPLRGAAQSAAQSATHSTDRFSAWPAYRPTCSGPYTGDRAACDGLSTGAMPSVDAALIPVSWEPSCGALGVPPPVYSPFASPREN